MANVTLITGSASGFGNGLTRALGARGHIVYAGMRDLNGRNRANAQALGELAGVHPIELDVRSDASVDAAVRAILEREGHIDVAVNNAGVAPFGLTECYTPEQLHEIFDVNVVGPQRVIRAVLPGMIARRSGLLLATSTVLARTTLPCSGVYAGSKAALESLHEAYSHELRGTGVDVAMVQPGAHPTEVASKGPFAADGARAAHYGDRANLLEQLIGGFYRVFGGPLAPQIGDVVDAMVAIVEAPAGQRPLRVPVDRMHGNAVEVVNHARDAARLDYIRRSGGIDP